MDNYSSYLKLKIKSDRKLASILDKAVNQVGQNLYDMASDALAGAERATWYLSCLTPGYADVCREQSHEDIRYFYGLYQAARREDVILDMVEIYFKKEIVQISDSAEQSLLASVAQYFADIASERLNKQTLAYFLAIIVLSSGDFKEAVVKAITKSMGTVIGAVSFYGKVQNAALSARKLKTLHPEYYWELYNNKIEMLYHLIESEMSKIIYFIMSGSNDEEELLFLIRELVRNK